MAQKTALSVIALPGKPHSFSPKTAAAAKGAGLFTALSVIGLPGKRHSFTAKTEAAAPSGPHTGLFTALSVLALPGKRHSFTAKTLYIPPAVEEAAPAARLFPGGGPYSSKETKLYIKSLENRIRDDDEILELVHTILLSGILDE